MIFKRGSNKNNLLQSINNLIKVKEIKERQKNSKLELTVIEYNTLIKCLSLSEKYLKHIK